MSRDGLLKNFLCHVEEACSRIRRPDNAEAKIPFRGLVEPQIEPCISISIQFRMACKFRRYVSLYGLTLLAGDLTLSQKPKVMLKCFTQPFSLSHTCLNFHMHFKLPQDASLPKQELSKGTLIWLLLKTVHRTHSRLHPQIHRRPIYI